MESSSGNSPGNSKKLTNIEKKNFASTDEILKNSTEKKNLMKLQKFNMKRGNKVHPSRLTTLQTAFKTQDSKAKLMKLEKMTSQIRFLKTWKKIKNSQQILKSQRTA